APRPARWLKPAAAFLRRLAGSPAVERGLFVARARHWRYTDLPGLSITATLTTLATSALDVANGSHPGMVRTHNEDAIFVDRAGLAVLADGMGGYNAGEVASGIAVNVIKDGLLPELS